MPFSANVFHVLIASPSDLHEERNAIAQSLHEWNSLHSRDTGKILLPVMWETHSAPAMGERPQGLINNQVVKSCDILIGSFWTRLGSHTGVEESGTVEEIKYFLSNKKPVMLYFCKNKIDPDVIDLDQYQKLKSFKASIRDKGIQEEYHGASELKEKLSRQLVIVMRDMSVGPIMDRKVVEAARASTREDDEEDLQATKKQGQKVSMHSYTAKSFVVRGSTVQFKQDLRAAGGAWNVLRGGGRGWVFSNRRLQQVAKILGIKPELEAL